MHPMALVFKHVVYLTLVRPHHSSLSDWLNLSDSHWLLSILQLRESPVCLVALRCNPLLPLKSLLCSLLVRSYKFQLLLYLMSPVIYPISLSTSTPNGVISIICTWPDPSFGQPSKVDILLGVDIYADVLLHGRQSGPCEWTMWHPCCL